MTFSKRNIPKNQFWKYGKKLKNECHDTVNNGFFYGLPPPRNKWNDESVDQGKKTTTKIRKKFWGNEKNHHCSANLMRRKRELLAVDGGGVRRLCQACLRGTCWVIRGFVVVGLRLVLVGWKSWIKGNQNIKLVESFGKKNSIQWFFSGSLLSPERRGRTPGNPGNPSKAKQRQEYREFFKNISVFDGTQKDPGGYLWGLKSYPFQGGGVGEREILANSFIQLPSFVGGYHSWKKVYRSDSQYLKFNFSFTFWFLVFDSLFSSLCCSRNVALGRISIRQFQGEIATTTRKRRTKK